MAKTKVEIAFATSEAADHFLRWLCGSGEQHYWHWMEAREDEHEGDITALVFNYRTPNGGDFGPKVTAECGRLDSAEEDL